jgi:hypothetical protein
MTTIKFDKSVKYQSVRYAAHEVFSVQDEDVADLKKAGATVLSFEPTTPPSTESNDKVEEEQEANSDSSENDDASIPTKEELLTFTATDLIKFARDNNIDLKGKTRKADIYNIIVASLD